MKGSTEKYINNFKKDSSDKPIFTNGSVEGNPVSIGFTTVNKNRALKVYPLKKIILRDTSFEGKLAAIYMGV